jgi:hypothetical protein
VYFPNLERQGLNSQQFSHLFLDEQSPSSLNIPFHDLTYVKKIGSGGFKDCFQGKKNNNVFYMYSFMFVGVYKGVWKKKHKYIFLQMYTGTCGYWRVAIYAFQ